MPVYRVQAPDGTILRIDGPEGASDDQLKAVAQDHYQKQINPNPADQSQYPEATPLNNFRAGMGKAFTDLATGYQQLAGKLDPMGVILPGAAGIQIPPEAVDQKRQYDAPLMKTTAGAAGDVAGNVAATLPLAPMPGINTLGGAALGGALYGAMEPVGTKDSRLANMGQDAALFAAAPLGVAGLKGAKAIAQPLYAGGRDAILGNLVNRSIGSNPDAIAGLNAAKQFVPGSAPTAADASGSAGLAMLENGAATSDPALKEALAQRMAANNSARVSALRDVAGDQSKLAYFQADRETAAKDLYGKAFAETPASTPYIRGQITQLMKRPAFIDALKDAQTIAANQGMALSEENAPQLLHFAKMALDDAASAAEGNAQKAILTTRDKVVSLLESKDFSPSYREARDTYAQMSQPINQMQVGQALYNKMVPALNDFGGTTRTRAQAFADAMRNGDVTAQQATNFPGARMESVMTPEQMGTLNSIGQDLSRRARTEDFMRGTGSNTAQNMAMQNVMSQVAGPLGLPQSFAQGLLSNAMTVPYVGGLLEFGAKGAEQKLKERLGQVLLDPKLTAQLLADAQRRQTPGMLSRVMRYLPPGRAGLLGLEYAGQ